MNAATKAKTDGARLYRLDSGRPTTARSAIARNLAEWRDRPLPGGLADCDYTRDIEPAYAYGLRARSLFRDRRWNPWLAEDLAAEWPAARGASRLDWTQARVLVRQAWQGELEALREEDRSAADVPPATTFRRPRSWRERLRLGLAALWPGA